MQSDIDDPIALGNDGVITINELVGVIGQTGGVDLDREYALNKLQGGDGRSPGT